MTEAEVRGAILVGGASRRFGSDKAFAIVGALTLAERVFRAIREVAAEVFVVGKAGRRNPLPRLEFLMDTDPRDCALAGVVMALSGADPRPVLIVACDHPFLVPAALALVASPTRAPARIPVVGGRLQPLLARYEPERCLPVFARGLATGVLSLRDALRELEVEVVKEHALRRVDPDLASFVNVNRPDDLETARRMSEKS